MVKFKILQVILEKPDGTKYFPARIITKTKIFDKQKDKKLDIIPGMQASVELQGDKRTVLDYLLTPYQKASKRSFYRDVI